MVCSHFLACTTEILGGIPGLVVTGRDRRSRDHGFESRNVQQNLAVYCGPRCKLKRKNWFFTPLRPTMVAKVHTLLRRNIPLPEANRKNSHLLTLWFWSRVKNRKIVLFGAFLVPVPFRSVLASPRCLWMQIQIKNRAWNEHEIAASESPVRDRKKSKL